MASSESRPLKTLWIWPTGLFPRRVIFYLKAKGLPLSVLKTPGNPSGELVLNSISLDMSVGLVPSHPNTEEKPSNCSLPVMRISGDGVKGGQQLIRQSTAILEYLEDVFPASAGYTDLSGGPEARARVRDIVHLAQDFIMWASIELRHATAFSLQWSGMTEDEQSATAAKDARRQCEKELAKLQEWAREDIMDRGTLSLAGLQDKPTLADFALAAGLEYLGEMYQLNYLEGYPVLQVWMDRYKKSQWFLSREEILKLEVDGFESLFTQ